MSYMGAAIATITGALYKDTTRGQPLLQLQVHSQVMVWGHSMGAAIATITGALSKVTKCGQPLLQLQVHYLRTPHWGSYSYSYRCIV